MYVTRPRSFYKKDPSALSVSPPEGPNSGYLVLQDEEAQSYCCFGLCKNRNISHPPLPQNKDLTVSYSESDGEGSITYQDKVIFIPVLNQPLSSNRYYVIRRNGKRQGYAMLQFCKVIYFYSMIGLSQIQLAGFPLCVIVCFESDM